MPKPIKTAFEIRILSIDTARLQLLREVDPRERQHEKYKQIKASITAVGVIEPLVVFPLGRGEYRVLDGRKRLDVLKDGNIATEVECLLATEDEAYTYNRRVNYLSPVAEHQMILRALAHNSQDRVAKALNVDVATIRRRLNLLTGVCEEAVEILKDRRATGTAFSVLKKMKPVRQVEVARLMVASKMYSGRFAQALLSGTRDDMLAQPAKDRSKLGDADQRHHLQLETDSLLRDLKSVEDSYGVDVLSLSLMAKYVSRMVTNTEVRHAMERRSPEILQTLESLLEEMAAESKIAAGSERSPRQRSATKKHAASETHGHKSADRLERA
jgi:ParB-like chromosome segregation protein Spo0J